MRHAVLIASVLFAGGLAALGVAACGGDAATDRLDCIAPTRLGDRMYSSTEVELRRALPPIAGEVAVTEGRCEGGARKLRAFARAGIPPSVALFATVDEARAGRRVDVLLAADAPRVAGHPALAWMRAAPARRRCTGRVERLTGRVEEIWPWLDLDVAGSRVRPELDRRTRLIGPRLDGAAHVEVGNRVELTRRRCDAGPPSTVAIRVLDRPRPGP